MSERERLPNLKENSKLIKFKEEINGVNEELLDEDESNITDINNLIYAATTIMTKKLISLAKEKRKKRRRRRNEKFGK